MLNKYTSLALLTAACTCSPAISQPLDLNFDQGIESWRVVLDGVMGGRSSGRVLQAESGILVFDGKLSLENNGGFSQIRKNISEGTLTDQDGVEIRFKGDGRTYQFDIRASNARLMAGGFQTTFDTTDGKWETIRIPFNTFQLYSFGRKVPNPPRFDPSKIESIGITLADKNPGDFRIEVDSIRSYQDNRLTTISGNKTLGSVAESAGLATLLKLVSISGIELPVGEQVTIFAPTDEAFSSLPSETVDFLVSSEGRATLQSILQYHIVPGAQKSNDLLNARSLPTLNGQDLNISLTNGLSISGASLNTVDVQFEGGIVHVIDSVLIPETKSILELAAQTEEVSTLVNAIGAAGIGSQLSSENGPWTVFAPINSAFTSLPEGVVEDLLQPENRTKLIDILGLHVVPGRISSSELLAVQRASTYFGNKIVFSLNNGSLTVQGAQIVTPDIQASNGVIHLIDNVILPVEAPVREQVSVTNYDLNSEAAQICELAIRRGAPLFNNGQREACAVIYEIAIESLVALGTDNLDVRGVERLVMALAEAQESHDWTDRAWIYRRALDEAYERFSTNMQ